jgi:AcrR family transcriptional regulator
MPTKADQLIDAALALFDEGGYHATGIDAILQRAGVAKMTLYKHFGSKEDLVVAALRRADERGRAEMFADIERRASAPRDRLLALFDFAEGWITGGSFRGCMFIRATGEFGDESGPIRAACREHSALVTRYLAGIAVQAGVASPEVLAQQLMLLLRGVLTAGQSNPAPEAIRPVIASARAAAATLIDAAIRDAGGSPA